MKLLINKIEPRELRDSLHAGLALHEGELLKKVFLAKACLV